MVDIAATRSTRSPRRQRPGGPSSSPPAGLSGPGMRYLTPVLQEAPPTELDGRPVYTRAGLMSRHRLGLSTLENWYRDRAVTGHPETAGTIGRALAWDAAEWDAWYGTWRETAGLMGADLLAEMVGRSRSTLARLWDLRAINGHPAARKRVRGMLYWDPQEYRRWFAEDYLNAVTRSLGVDFSGRGDDELTLAELGRVLGLAAESMSVYANWPPIGWPEPIIDKRLDSGQHRYRYTRRQAWEYAAHHLGQCHPSESHG